MKKRAFSVLLSTVVTVAMVSPLLSKAYQTFGGQGHLAEADLYVNNDFTSASAYTENEIFGATKIAVSLMAYNASGNIVAIDGVYYSPGRAEASLSDMSGVTRYKSIHGMYDWDGNYIISITNNET